MNSKTLTFKVEAFNAFNHFNPNNPNSGLTLNFNTGANTNCGVRNHHERVAAGAARGGFSSVHLLNRGRGFGPAPRYIDYADNWRLHDIIAAEVFSKGLAASATFHAFSANSRHRRTYGAARCSTSIST